MQPTKEQIESYEGNCALCKFFEGSLVRDYGREEEGHLWLDDAGWCVRYPPVFVGGIMKFDDDCDTGRFKQPGVFGSDSCGEYVRSLEFNNGN